MVETSPQWPPASPPCATMMIDARLRLTHRMLGRAHQRRDRHAMLAAHLDHLLRRHAESVGDQFDRMTECNLDELERVLLLHRERRIGRTHVPLLERLRRLDIVLREQVAHEILMLLRNALRELAVRHALLVLDRQILRNKHVDAVGFSVNVIVDPLQFLFELSRREAGRAEHAETARATHRRDHVTAMSEGEATGNRCRTFCRPEYSLWQPSHESSQKRPLCASANLSSADLLRASKFCKSQNAANVALLSVPSQIRISHNGKGSDVAFRRQNLGVSATALVVAVAAVAAAYFWLWRQPTTNNLLVSGNIEAHESVLSFKTVQSRIVELPFDEGQWVKAGTLLARLEDHDYRQQVVVDEATLLVQQRQLALALRNLEAARRTVAIDQADLWEKTIDYQRDQELWQKNVISTQTRDLAETALKQSRATFERDQALRAAAEESVSVTQANIKNAQASLKLAKIILGYTTLYAPY